jgi:hypothetical protein
VGTLKYFFDRVRVCVAFSDPSFSSEPIVKKDEINGFKGGIIKSAIRVRRKVDDRCVINMQIRL